MAADPGQIRPTESVDHLHAVLRALVPEADAFSLYDKQAVASWRSSSEPDETLDALVRDLDPAILRGRHPDAFLESRTADGRHAVAVQLTARPLGVLVAVFNANNHDAASVSERLAPAIALMSERLEASRRFEEVRAELEVVYDVDDQIHGVSRSHSALARLIGQSGRFLEIGYSVLLIPSKRIRISATHASWKSANRKVIDRYLVDHMLPKLEGRTSPVVFEIPPMDGDGGVSATGFQTLLTPIVGFDGLVDGVLAQLGRVNGRPFFESHQRFMGHIGRKVQYVIDRSYDAKTGLMNRKGFESQLEESHRSLEASNDSHQLIFIDIDQLKLVNDKFGREAGDEVVSRIASLLAEDLPGTAVLSRLEGDKFCILLTHANTESALALAESAKEGLQGMRYLKGDESIQLSVSIGIAEFNQQNGLNGEALTNARMACDGAQSRGRDCVHVYDEENLSMIRRHDDLNLVAEIQRALDNDAFQLMAQPIMSLANPDETIRYEILIRLDNVAGERIPTDAFLSAAESFRMMPQIDRWVARNTLRAIKDNLTVLDGRGARFSVNLSGQSLADDGMFEFLSTGIRESGVPLELIGFEITESAAVSNFGKARDFIRKLREMGCKISLDDFGAGLSSFAYLKNFEVDTLKVDGGFIRDITENRISESMVTAITQVAKVMGLETVAEYVETPEIQDIIERIGVDYAQGHGIGKARPLDDVMAQLADLTKGWLD